MRYSKQEFMDILKEKEYPLTVGFTVDTLYRTPTHRERLRQFFAPFGEVIFASYPFAVIPTFNLGVPTPNAARQLTDRLYDPDAADVLESLATIDAGDAFIFACSGDSTKTKSA